MREEALVWKERIGYITVCLEKKMGDSLKYFMPKKGHGHKAF